MKVRSILRLPVVYERACTETGPFDNYLCSNRLVSSASIASLTVNQRPAVSRSDTAQNTGNETTPWLAGLDLAAFPGPGIDRQIAQAARYIHADILSPAAVHGDSPVKDSAMAGYIPFTTKVRL